MASAEKRSDKVVRRIRSWVRVLRYGTRAKKWAAVGLASFAAATAVSKAPGWLELELPEEWSGPQSFLSLGLATLGGFCLLACAIVVWRRVTAPPPPPAEPKPSAIKGVSSFGPDDGELFWRLGRNDELNDLRGWLRDDQVPFVAVQGESGVGKTSLLRAGLSKVLKDDDIAVIYWEAIPSRASHRLLSAIQAGWHGSEDNVPSALDEVAKSSDGRQRTIVVDQAEQLDPQRDSEIFEAFESALQAEPPYETTWVVSFREEYSRTWLRFLARLPEVRQRMALLALERFTTDEACEIVSVIADEAGLDELQEADVQQIVRGVADSSGVSPVDIGIALVVLRESGAATLRELGGHDEIMATYLESRIRRFPDDMEEPAYKALRHLVDWRSSQRIAEGRSIEELVHLARPSREENFVVCLERLEADRILESPSEAEEPRFRLGHERVIPGLKRLLGVALAGVEEASLTLDRNYGRWREEPKSANLLRGRDLAAVLRHQKEIVLREGIQGKLEYIDLSKRRRIRSRGLGAVAFLVIVLVTWMISAELREFTFRKELFAWGLPPDLLELKNLKSLSVSNSAVSHLEWLPRADEISLAALNRVTSLAGIPEGLTSLTLDLNSSPVTNLDWIPQGVQTLELLGLGEFSLSGIPESVTSLSLHLRSSTAVNLQGIPEGVKTLKLDLSWSQMASLKGIPDGVLNLELHLENSRVTSLSGIPEGVKTLTLDLGSEIRSLEEIPKGVTTLKLSNATQISTLEGLPDGVANLDLGLWSKLANLKGLPNGVTTLKLDFWESPIQSLEGLPESLRALTLVNAHFLTGNESIPDGLTTLALGTGSRLSLDQIPSSVMALSLSDTSQLTSLEGIPREVKTLELDLWQSKLVSLKGIPDGVTNLTLHLRESEVKSLEGIPSGVTTLELGLWSQILSLEGIPEGVKTLKLDYWLNRMSTLNGIPDGVEDLTLNLRESVVRSLDGIPDGVTTLSLEIADSPLRSLVGIPSGVASLTLDLECRGTWLLEEFARVPHLAVNLEESN